MKIAIGCDHGGFVLKSAIVEYLSSRGIEVVDYGTDSEMSVDYPIYGEKVAKAVSSHECDKGILMCGTGIGISIAANKVKGIRCGVAHDEFTAEMTGAHNGSNILAMGGRVVRPELAVKMVKAWLDAPQVEGRHQKRVDMISDIEKRSL